MSEPLCSHKNFTKGCPHCIADRFVDGVEKKKLKWTQEELDEHIRVNVKDYGAMVVVAFLYKKIYGYFPKCGMSGTQAEFADSVLPLLPSNQTGKAA